MNFELTKEQQMIKKSASDFAKSKLEPIAYDDDRSGAYPDSAVSEMAKNDFLGMRISSEWNGVGADFTSMVLMAEAFGKANAAAAAIAITHNVMAADPIQKYGTQDQKSRYLPLLQSGQKLGGFAVAEPGAALASGPDKVTAKKEGDSYVLTGKKTFVYNGGVADLYLVIAQTKEEAGQKGISVFLVDGAQVKTVNKIDKLGLRAFPTAELEFDHAKAELLGKEEDGPEITADIQAKADIAFAAMAAGIGDAMLEDSAMHCKTRIQFGAPIGRLQAVQWLLAEIASQVHLLRLMAYQGAACADTGGNYVEEAAYAKMHAMKAGVDAGMNAVQIHGGMGYSREGKIERYFRDIRGAFLIENAVDYPQRTIAGSLLK